MGWIRNQFLCGVEELSKLGHGQFIPPLEPLDLSGVPHEVTLKVGYLHLTRKVTVAHESNSFGFICESRTRKKTLSNFLYSASSLYLLKCKQFAQSLNLNNINQNNHGLNSVKVWKPSLNQRDYCTMSLHKKGKLWIFYMFCCHIMQVTIRP